MGRKRANGKVKTEVPQKLAPLMQNEAQYFNELVESSNQYSNLLKQKAQYEFIVGQLQENRKKVQKGEIELPVGVVLIPKVMTYQEADKKKVLAMFDKHINIFQQNLATLAAQLEFAHENFSESGVRNKEFLAKRFNKVEVKNVAPKRQIIKDEETLFEAELTDMAEDGEKVKEFKKAMKTAVEHNKQSKTACECKSCKNRK